MFFVCSASPEISKIGDASYAAAIITSDAYGSPSVSRIRVASVARLVARIRLRAVSAGEGFTVPPSVDIDGDAGFLFRAANRQG